MMIGTSGQQCVRGLNCKSHSMAARRNVSGRSLPFDTLLNMYMAKASKKLAEKSIPDQDGQRAIDSPIAEIPSAKNKPDISTDFIEFKPIVMKSWFFPKRKQDYYGLKAILAFPLKVQKRMLQSKKNSSISPTQSSFDLSKQTAPQTKRPSASANSKESLAKKPKASDDYTEENGKIFSMPQLHL